MNIRCVDFETTGTPTADVRHALCEVGWCDVSFDEADMADGFAVPILSQPQGFLVNPGRPIPPEAMAVHHISDADVAGAPGPDVACRTLATGDIAYYAAHNAEFEAEFFGSAVTWICTYKVALRLWPDLPSHGLQYLRYALPLDLDQSLGLPAHRAVPDAYVGAVLLARIIEEGRASIAEMVRWSSGRALLPRCPLKKYRDKPWSEVPTDYLVWIVENIKDNPDVVANAKHSLKQRDALR